jgi:hypothetical protein
VSWRPSSTRCTLGGTALNRSSPASASIASTVV